MVRAVVDTGLRKKNIHYAKGEDPEKEYVLDPNPPQLTLGNDCILICMFLLVT